MKLDQIKTNIRRLIKKKGRLRAREVAKAAMWMKKAKRKYMRPSTFLREYECVFPAPSA